MRSADLVRTLKYLDTRGVWLMSSQVLRMYFPQESDRSFFASLDRHAKPDGNDQSLIRRFCKGLWYNPAARSMPVNPLQAAVASIRPYDFNYLSLESVLSAHGVISQIPFTTTIMSTAAPAKIKTDLGTLEFVQTRRRDIREEPRIRYSADEGIHVASVSIAWRDLRRVGRNLGLVNEDDLQEALAEEEAFFRAEAGSERHEEGMSL